MVQAPKSSAVAAEYINRFATRLVIDSPSQNHLPKHSLALFYVSKTATTLSITRMSGEQLVYSKVSGLVGTVVSDRCTDFCMLSTEHDEPGISYWIGAINLVFWLLSVASV